MNCSTSQVAQIIEMGVGTRVELDFIDILDDDEGVLVGDTARGFVLVLAETRLTETYPPRPFRVNAGSVHQYVCVQENETKYLSELKAGDRVLVTNGNTGRLVSLGRVKKEKREFLRVVLNNGVSATLQKADSIYISGEDTTIHFIDIKEGNLVVNVESEAIARHIGKAISEEIIEE